jgi:hypothetical protein
MDHIDWLRRHNSGIRAIAFWFGVRTMFWSRTTFFTCTLFFKWSTTNKIQLSVFSSPDPKDQVSYCHHLASVVVVRRKLFQKSSPLKVLDQWKPNLVWIITMVSSFKNVSGDAVHQPTWPLLLKIHKALSNCRLSHNMPQIQRGASIQRILWISPHMQVMLQWSHHTLQCNRNKTQNNVLSKAGVESTFNTTRLSNTKPHST